MGSSSKNKPPENPQKGRASKPWVDTAPQLVGQQMDPNAAAIMGAPTGPQPDPSRGLGPLLTGGDPQRQMLAQQMMQQMQQRSDQMAVGGRGARGMGGAFGNGFGGGRGGNTPGGGYGGGKRGGGLY